LAETTSYEVQSSVAPEDFQVFVKALETTTQVRLTEANTASISLLAEEFGVTDRYFEWSRHPDTESFEAIDCTKQVGKPVDGIIADLTRSAGGNAHDKGIVTIPTKSIISDDPQFASRNIADLTSDTMFVSKDEPNQWICWNFHEARVCPNRYTIRGRSLESSILDRSDDGIDWTEIDRRIDHAPLVVPETGGEAFGAFSMPSPCSYCHFLRPTQPDKNHNIENSLTLVAFEVFGNLVVPATPLDLSTPNPLHALRAAVENANPNRRCSDVFKEVSCQRQPGRSLRGILAYHTIPIGRFGISPIHFLRYFSSRRRSPASGSAGTSTIVAFAPLTRA
jgi:hypothetical protein